MRSMPCCSADIDEVPGVRAGESGGRDATVFVSQAGQDLQGIASLDDVRANGFFGDGHTGRRSVARLLRELGDLPQGTDGLGDGSAGDLDRSGISLADGHDCSRIPGGEDSVELPTTFLWHIGVQRQHEADLVALCTNDTDVNSFRAHREPGDTREVRTLCEGQGDCDGRVARAVGDVNGLTASGHICPSLLCGARRQLTFAWC